MKTIAYVLDANVFIEASRRYYAFDLAPVFWENLIRYAQEDKIKSIDRVKQELDRGKDELSEWANHDFHEAFVSTNDSSVINVFKEIMIWVDSQKQFSPAAKADFAQGADGWLVAYAKVHNCVVVTHETISAEAKRTVPIPNVCQAFDVSFVDTFEMLRRLRIKFL
jgi:hypothetical protein